jgi:hypothetical protein
LSFFGVFRVFDVGIFRGFLGEFVDFIEIFRVRGICRNSGRVERFFGFGGFVGTTVGLEDFFRFGGFVGTPLELGDFSRSVDLLELH